MSTLTLLKNINLPLDLTNTIDFISDNVQQTYFQQNIWKSYDNVQFIRENFMVTVPESYQTLTENGIRYCYYILNDSEKVYYAFITRIEWASQSSANLYLYLDVLQTYMFDYKLEKCLVNTSHLAVKDFSTAVQDVGVNNYRNTTGNLLNFNPFINNNTVNNYFIITCTCNLATSGGTEEQPKIISAQGSIIDNGQSGLNFYLVPQTTLATSTQWAFNELIDYLSEMPWVISCIESIVYVPYDMVNHIAGFMPTVTIGNKTITFLERVSMNNVNRVLTIENPISFVLENTKPYFVGKGSGFQLTRSPFTMLEMFTCTGNTVTLLPELFENYSNGTGVIEFQLFYILSETPKLYIVPKNYDNMPLNFENALVFADFPTYSANVDNGKLVLAQNASQISQQRANYYSNASNLSRVNQLQQSTIANQQMINNINTAFNTASNFAGAIGSGLQGNIGGTLNNAVNMANNLATWGLTNKQSEIDKATLDAQTAMSRQNAYNSWQLSLASIKDAQLINPSIAGLSGGDKLLVNSLTKYELPFISVVFKQPYLDELKSLFYYFKIFGTKVNTFEYPNVSVREGKYRNKVNSIKCDSVNIVAYNIPTNFVEQIKQCYLNGITFWHYPTEIFDYSWAGD